MIIASDYFHGLSESYRNNGLNGVVRYEFRSTGKDLIDLCEIVLGVDITDSLIASAVEGCHSLPRIIMAPYTIWKVSVDYQRREREMLEGRKV